MDYPRAALKYVPDVGRTIAKFIEFLVTEGETTYDDIILTGHSLGTHIVGIAGKNTKQKVNTIYGLDPAGPLFFYSHPQKRIAAGDGKYVEIIHTAGRSLGFFEPLGDADFYVNGGKLQPGCSIETIVLCSHSRSPTYFAESLNSDNEFWAVRCSSKHVEMNKCKSTDFLVKIGGDPAYSGDLKRGTFYLETNSESPFALGKSFR